MGELVFDVGLHNGDDTAYYLAHGYDVVAVEANPEFCAAAKKRFAIEVQDGRLAIRNVGIAKQAGELTFWISERSEWSSFDHANATRTGISASPIVVPAVRFADILNDYGQALYVKIDIEGSDSACIHDLERCQSLPSCISFEGHPNIADDIELLAKMDYLKFKFIRQNDWREITPENMRRQGAMRVILSSVQRFPLIFRCLGRIHYRSNRINGHACAPGSSGPLARELPGRWLDCAEVLAVVAQYYAISKKLQVGPLEEWFDIHASR
jgi:FkbM family methyltransferase